MGALIPEAELRAAVGLLVRLVEVAAAVVIFVGAALGFARICWRLVKRRGASSFVAVRLDLGRFLALGLEFQLGADLLRTAVAPTFREIGQLAAVAAIRTALNFFLDREIREERREVAESAPAGPARAAPER